MNPPDTALKAFTTTRTLNAPRELVFDVWTQKEHLAQWFGPKGSTLHVEKLDLKVGGIFHYSMGFGGQTMWGRWIFKEIVRPERIVLISSFSDEKGGIGSNPWKPEWPKETLSTTTFTEQNGVTTLTLEWKPLNATPSQIAGFNEGRSGMEMGWKGTFEALSAYLATLKA